MTKNDSDREARRPRHRGPIVISFLLGFFSLAGLLVVLYLLLPVIQGSNIRPPRTAVPAAELDTQKKDALASSETKKDAHTKALVERMFARQQQDPEATMDFLILSGGGANGAFGAGFLLGWATVPPGPDALPTFDGVSGVSTGSFIAPFAYLGTDEARKEVDDFFRNPKPDWVTLRKPISFHPKNLSLMQVSGIKRDLEKIVDLDFATQIDKATTDGRILMIQASNIDAQVPGVFDFSDAARKAIESNDATNLHEIILASCAIPAVFPPREIDGTLYVDGGAIGNFYAGGRASSPDDTFGGMWKKLHPDAPIPKTRYWVILNGNLRIPPAISEPTWPSVADRAFQLLYTSAEITSLRYLYALAELTRLRGDGDVEVRWISVEKELVSPNPMNMFDAATMRSLSDDGQRIGADPKSWNTVAP